MIVLVTKINKVLIRNNFKTVHQYGKDYSQSRHNESNIESKKTQNYSEIKTIIFSKHFFKNNLEYSGNTNNFIVFSVSFWIPNFGDLRLRHILYSL